MRYEIKAGSFFGRFIARLPVGKLFACSATPIPQVISKDH